MLKSWMFTRLLILLVLLAATGQLRAQVLAVEGGTLIDGTGGRPLPNSVVIIEGNRFKTIGAKGKVVVPPNATVVHAEGKTVLPGFIDTQVGGNWPYQPPIWLHFGVTTVYYNGGCARTTVGRALGTHREEKAAVTNGLVPGPRIYLPIGYFDPPIELAVPDMQEIRKGFPAYRGYAVAVRTPDEVIAAVNKFFPEGGESVGVHEGLPPQLLGTLSAEAHKHGLMVAGRAEFAGEAVDNGQDIVCYMGSVARSTITNPVNVAKLKDLRENHWQQYWRSPVGNYEYMMEADQFEPLIQKMVRRHAFFAPTISHAWWEWGTQIPHSKVWTREVIDFAKNTPGLDYVNETKRGFWLNADRPSTRLQKGDAIGDQVDATGPQDMEGYAKQDEFIRRFVKAGGRIMGGGGNSNENGQDNGDMVPGLVTHQELEQLVYSGLTPMQAILSVTRWAAEAYHKEKEIGSVEPGKFADLIIVNGNPLMDIRSTRNVTGVIVNGKQISTDLNSQYRYPVTPVISLAQSSLQFESQKVNTTSKGLTVLLTNRGTETLNIANIVTSGDFAQTNDCRYLGTDPTGISPGQSCTITVTFTPTAIGARTGRISIAGGSADLYEKPRSIALTGTASE